MSAIHSRSLWRPTTVTEEQVRQLVDGALETGSAVDPNGQVQAWRYVESGPAEILASEAMHARRLASSPR